MACSLLSQETHPLERVNLGGTAKTPSTLGSMPCVKGEPMKRTRALSTGQAAKYCLVTADTIVNWIKRNDLPARRTVGGQYRILVEDLRRFMIERGMKTDLLEEELDSRKYCWEYCERTGFAPMQGQSCADCLVQRSLTLNCYELRSAFSCQSEELDVCGDCLYLAEWHQSNSV